MGLFSGRKPVTEMTNGHGNHVNEKRTPNKLANRHRHPARANGQHSIYSSDSLNIKPSFGQWLKVTWPDLLTMVVMGVLGLGIYTAPPAPSRSFPVFFADGEVIYPQFAYPLRHEIVPIWLAALLASLIPIAVFLVMQIRIRSFWDMNNATIGLLYSLITAAVFQVFVKWLIGGLRPHFLAVCKPVIPEFADIQSRDGNVHNGFNHIMYDRKICTGDTKAINDALESMPSGHTTAAFAGFVFLYLYLNAKLKVWSNYHPAYWKLIVTYMPILGAVLIGGALTIDEYHNWYDVLAGAIIGTVMAFSAYRMVYASVFDFRYNHVPLSRGVPFAYGHGPSAFDGFGDALWTRQVGWGLHEGGASPRGAPLNGSSGVLPGHGHKRHVSADEDDRPRDARNGRRSVSRKPVGSTNGLSRGEQMV